MPRLELPGGAKRTTAPLGTPLCLAWGREMQANVILKEPPPWVPPFSLSVGGTRRGGLGGAAPPSHAPADKLTKKHIDK